MSGTTGGVVPTRLRQIAFVTDDLDSVRKQLTYVLGTEVIFEDPGVAQWGLKNILVPLGGDIIEVVTPTRPNTTAGRLLSKRGSGGYMIIMQNEDARARREYIEKNGLSKVIWGYDHGDIVCVQYHPKGIMGGMMPELDSHAPSTTSRTPLQSRFSAWHACGSDHKTYYPGMKRAAHLSLQACTLRLQNGQKPEDAAKQWEGIFGVARKGAGAVQFTNAQMKFVDGVEGESEGLVEITVGVQGRDALKGVWERARELGVAVFSGERGWVEMCGVRWNLVLAGEEAVGKVKL